MLKVILGTRLICDDRVIFKGFFFGQKFVVLHTIPSIFGKFWCVFGGIVVVSTKKNYIYVHACQIHLDTPKVARKKFGLQWVE